MEKQIALMIKPLEKYIYEGYDENYYIGGIGVDETAKEITQHVFEFVEWFHENYNNRFLTLQVDDGPKQYISNVGSLYKSLPQIYDLWLNNVKDC